MLFLSPDYQSVPQRIVSIEPLSNLTCFSGQIVDDLIGLEGNEFFTLLIEETTQGGVVVERDLTTIYIIDDDGKNTCICL